MAHNRRQWQPSGQGKGLVVGVSGVLTQYHCRPPCREEMHVKAVEQHEGHIDDEPQKLKPQSSDEDDIKLPPLSKLPHPANGRPLNLDRFNVDRLTLHGGFSVELELNLLTHRSQAGDHDQLLSYCDH
ncbi:hypothetical protein TNCV_1311801 [Trichonephila clavipes]|nr:hypothetical protein TNCV_1311801 [Trichonephila clavipes]